MVPRLLIDVDEDPSRDLGLSEELLAGTTPLHVHRKHQLLYASAGMLHLQTESAQWLLPPQRAAFLSAGTRHQVRVPTRASLRTVYFAPRPMTQPAAGCWVFPVEPLLREAVLYATKVETAGRAQDEVHQALFALLNAMCERARERSDPFCLPVPKSPELSRVVAYVLDRLDQDVDQGQAARVGGLSERTLARRFADEMQTTWRQFIGQARMLRAMEMLLEPGARVTETALSLGYESLSAFTRAFTAFSGETPREYQRHRLPPRERSRS